MEATMSDASRQPQIVAIGGGGFSTDLENLLLERYVLSVANRERPRILFLATASGDAQDYIARFYEAFESLQCSPSHLSLFSPSTADLQALVLGQDIVYVGGGNTKSMLALWREWGLDTILRDAWQRGVVMAGVSAGSICWFEQGITDSIPGAYTAIRCLGFVHGSNCPRFDSEPDRQSTYRMLVAGGSVPEGYAVDDGVALHFMDDSLYGIVTARPAGKAHRLERSNGGVKETTLDPVPLSEYLKI
jgi:dipeptidase E